MTNAYIRIGVAATLIATAFSVTAGGPSRAGPDPGTCAPGWRPATPPLNPVLGCLPNNLYIGLDPDGGLASIPPGECPAGWNRVTPPLNPLLMCLPANLKDPMPLDPAASRPDPFCPPGWQQATDPLNFVLGCLPNQIVSRLPDSRNVPDCGVDCCPEGWKQVTSPLNPLLGCLPDTFVDPANDPYQGR